MCKPHYRNRKPYHPHFQIILRLHIPSLLVFIYYFEFSYFIASMPLVISETSRVMDAWRTLLYVRVSPFAISCALSVALFIATIRAECSEAFDSRSAWNTAMFSNFGRSTESTASASGSIV